MDDLITPAMIDLEKSQKKYPPLYARIRGADRAQQLYEILAPCLPQELRNMVSSGTVAIGEIGRNSPEVWYVPLEGDGAVIRFHSGMIDFIYAVIRSLSGLMVKVTTSGPQNEPAVSRAEVARYTANLFRQWKWPNRWIWAIRRISYPTFEIAGSVHGRVEEVAKYTELFLLAHELGHVAVDHGLFSRASEDVELQADTVALELMCNLAAIGGIDLADAYGAAVLAVRICAGLETAGVRFASLPSQSDRLKSLRNVAISVSPSMQYFHEISRIAVSYQDLMDGVDDQIYRHPITRVPDAERVLVRLIAELLDTALGRLKNESLANHISELVATMPPEVMRHALHTLHDYYVHSPPADSFIDAPMRERMGHALLEVMGSLPAQIKDLFSN